LVIESTGLADPFPILSTLKADSVLRHHFRPGNVITTVDAINGLGQLQRYAESSRQAVIADQLVITKTDMTNTADYDQLLAQLALLNPDATVTVVATACNRKAAFIVMRQTSLRMATAVTFALLWSRSISRWIGPPLASG
jgi:G3E family GTPase